MTKTIDQLLAESEIKDLHIRYCRAADRVDFELLRSCFHDDAQLHYGLYDGDVAGFIAMAGESLSGFESTSHFTGNQLVEVDGDEAWAEHYTAATHRLRANGDQPESDLLTMVRYADHVEHRAGAWRFSRRTLMLDSWRLDPVVPAGAGPEVQPGRRDRSDPSYRRFPAE